MRRDPVFLVWHIHGYAPEQREIIQKVLRERGSLDYVETDKRLTYPNGVEKNEIVPHRLGDYFARIELISDSIDYPKCLRLLFQRRPDAGRFWKDLMVRVLARIREVGANLTITLAYQGDNYAAECAVGN